MTTTAGKLYWLPIFLLFITTLNGQSLLKDIQPGIGSSNPDELIDFNGSFVFTANDGSNGTELWISDGTATGTQLLKDVNGTTAGSSITQLTHADGVLYFVADDGINGAELWTSDGTPTGTTMVIDINGLPTSSNITGITPVNNQIFFAADDGASGQELWMSDGTPSGTQMVFDINPSGSSNPSELIINDAGLLFFTADDGTNGTELWTSDGTSFGTAIVTDINPSGSATPQKLETQFGNVYFEADDGTNGPRLWQSDGKASGTVNVTGGFFGTTPIANPDQIKAIGNELFFTHSFKLNKLTSTSSISMTVAFLPSGTNPSMLTDASGHLFFRGSSGSSMDNDLWYVRSGALSATKIAGFSATIDELTNVNGVLYFQADNGSNGQELWISNGASAATVQLADINSGSSSSSPSALVAVDGNLFFAADNGSNGKELYKHCPVCSDTYSPIPESAGTFTASTTTTDVDGWTHYCDQNGYLLLSLRLGGTNAVIPASGVSLQLGASQASYYAQNCGSNNCFITNPNGAAIINRTWDVSPSTQPDSEVGVKHYFTQDEYHEVTDQITANGGTTLNSFTDLHFYKVTNNSLGSHPTVTVIGPSDIIDLANGTASTQNWALGTKMASHEYYAEFMVDAFSGGGGGGSSAGGAFLPVELVKFELRQQSKIASLNWTTASERNSDGFIIQHSTDGIQWSDLGFVPSHQNSVVEQHYHFTTELKTAGIHYFRLKMTDLDGAYDHSLVRSIQIKNTEYTFLVYPNPVAGDVVQIEAVNTGKDGEISEIRLYNGTGTIIKSWKLGEGRMHHLNLGDGAPGLYLLEIIGSENSSIHRLIRQ